MTFALHWTNKELTIYSVPLQQSTANSALQFFSLRDHVSGTTAPFDDPRLYELHSEQTQPGTTLRSILAARVNAGISPEHAEQ